MSVPAWFKKLLVPGIIVIVCIGIWFVLDAMYPTNVQGFKNKDRVVLDTSTNNVFPYTTEPINSIDQYELEAVFNLEGDKALSKHQINQMTKRFPLDWVNLPPNSSRFQSEQAKYVEGFSTKASAEDLEAPYKDIGDSNLTPPDTLAMEHEERKILATYAPKNGADLTTYDVDDAQALLEKIYKPKGIVPEVRRKEGNVFEVVRTRSMKDIIQYEDDLPDAPASTRPLEASGEARIVVPPVATDTAAGLDPYFEPTTATRPARQDYMQWTPGLERMFAPTNAMSDWVGQPHDSKEGFEAPKMPARPVLTPSAAPTPIPTYTTPKPIVPKKPPPSTNSNGGLVHIG